MGVLLDMGWDLMGNWLGFQGCEPRCMRSGGGEGGEGGKKIVAQSATTTR